MTRGKVEKRGSKRRQVKPVILIVTEGSQTEPKYFEHFRNRQINIDIRVVGSRSSAGATDYVGLIRKAAEYKDKNQLLSDIGDAVWVVADGDVNYNNPDPVTAKDTMLKHARKIADQKEIQLAISNPCFELWFLLHFQYTTKFLKDYDSVKVMLKNYLKEYEKSDDVFVDLGESLEAALENSRKLENYHLQNGSELSFGIGVNPFTDVHHLVESLI